MAEKTNLSILIVGPDAADIAAAENIKELEALGDTITISTIPADIVIGTNCIRTYPSTTNFLKALLKKIRNEKKSLQAPYVVKTPKKKVSKKKALEASSKDSVLKEEGSVIIANAASAVANGYVNMKLIHGDVDYKEHTEEDMVMCTTVSTSTVVNNEKL